MRADAQPTNCDLSIESGVTNHQFERWLSTSMTGWLFKGLTPAIVYQSPQHI
jgi:hypothetical protein